MNKRRFIQILKKYRHLVPTDEEQRFIETYYHLFETEPELEAWLNGAERQELKENILHGIWEKIQREQSQNGDIKIKRWTAGAVRIAAAILAVLCTGAIIYLISGPGTGKKAPIAEKVERPVKDNIQPGGNKAVLTLASGKRLILDSMHNGLMAHQGNTKVLKLNGGQLAYEGVKGDKQKEQKLLYNTIATPRGGQYRIILADGTKIWLNAASSLHFPTAFTGRTRTVTVSGEVYLEVAKDPGRPFIVQAGGARVEVLGTRFNVNTYDEKVVRTTLANGAIRISERDESRLLRPGEQAILDKKTAAINIRKVRVDRVLAWKAGFFSFNNTNIRTIMEEVARWYDVRIKYATEDLATKNFSGVISRYSNVEALLERLTLTGTVHFRVEGKQITVMN
ncbi:MAG TPA: FecR domain-containing protein [Chitinophagaceae bacterium]|nr:FecR domain-containing protein [Chitinophagaceae bacterium]